MLIGVSSLERDAELKALLQWQTCGLVDRVLSSMDLVVSLTT